MIKPKKITRPLIPIDYKKLDAMCAIHCTGEECAAILGIDYDTLNRGLKREGHKGFTEYFKQKGANGKMSLRRKQFDHAMSGNATMLIWLGKQWLGQVDKQEESNELGAQPLTINFEVAKPVGEIKITNADT
tara:strand:+ start:1095 stop:1490 length:396 start_codon:yes stop_codon:yes gene_type:complete